MNKLGKPSFFKASMLAALMTTALGAQAAGLGKLTVYSAIGQPLKAEVALTATPDELGSLTAKLASPEAFREAGIEFMSALAGLNLSVVNTNKGQPVLKLATDRPLNEPFLHFLVELSWTSGRLVREYTFLLDPPEMLQVAKAASVVSPVAPTASSLPMSRPLSVEKPAPQATRPSPAVSGMVKAPAAPVVGSEYQVVRGDTLSKIARQNKSESVSLDQMLVALFNGNRDAFDGNNMNRLRAGKILRMPDAAEAAKVDAGEAHKLIIGQAAEFNAYRRRLADAAGAVPVADAAPRQQASGVIKPRVEEKAPPVEAKDKLEVSRTETAKSAKAIGGSSLEEDLIARDKALREASGRIADLEKNIENLKHLVEIKSQTGAKLQQEGQAAAPAQPVEAKPSAPGAEPAAPPAPVEPPKQAEPAPAVAKPVPAQAKKPVAPPPPPPEPDFIAENPQLVFGGGALAALLLGYFGYAATRKKRMLGEAALGESGIEASHAAEPSTSAAVFGAASEHVDNGDVSIQGDFSDVGMLTTEEKVDPVAEADVLMAYGRDRQAEEILLEGLRQDSERPAIHMKLLDLYAKQENISQFEAVANKLHELNGGRGADWDRAVAMARNLGLAGGLFQGVGVVAGAETSAVAESPAVPEQMQPVDETVMAAPAQEAVFSKAEDTGSLDFDLDLGTASGPTAAEIEPAAATPAPEEAMSLDFDFDLGAPQESAAPPLQEEPEQEASADAGDGSIDFSFDLDADSEAKEAVVAEPEEAVASIDAENLDFDLDLGGAVAPDEAEVAELILPDEEASSVADAPVESSAAPVQESAMAPPSASGLDVDFDLELEAEPAPETSADASESTSGLDVEVPAALDLADISLDLDEIEPVAPSAEPSTPAAGNAVIAEVAVAEGAEPPDLPSMAASADVDFGTDIGDAQPEAAPATVLREKPVSTTVDLPDFDLSVDAGEATSAVADEIESAVVSDGELALDVEAAAVDSVSEPDNPEVTTKLELAQAYEEMGDKEGARDLLNEVLGEGSAAQQAQARIRLDQLGA